MTPAHCAMMIRLNVLGTTFMTRYFIDDLLAQKPSYLINVSSLSAYFHLPNKQVYGASKAYVYSFTRGLQAEYRNSGLNITVVCPGGLNSNVRSVVANNRVGWFARRSITSPQSVAAQTMRACFRGKAVVNPGKFNKLFLLVSTLLPSGVKAKITSMQMKKLTGVEQKKSN
jgi:short-subunit dehydrogenase